jgi:hypothetical protein
MQNGTVLDVVESSEPMARLKLEDGTLVRIKISVIEVMRMDEPGADGKPAYDINASLAATFVSPEEQLDD